MKKRFLISIVLLIAAVPGILTAGEPLTSAEREALLAHLDRTNALLSEAVNGLSPEQWNYKPAPDRWSIAENVEHLVLSEALLRGITEQAMQEEASAERLANARKEEKLMALVVDRSNRVKTFEPLEPAGRWPSQAEALAKFQSERAATRTLADKGGDLRAYVGEHPLVQDLDAYGFLMFTSGHTERHVLQIEEVKSSEGYPR